jgi:hypothetical protein
MESASIPQYTVIVLAGLILLLLLALVWRNRLGRRTQKRKSDSPRTPLSEAAANRKFSSKEYQILLAIASQGGVRRPERVVTSRMDFDKGAAKLLSEFARARTPGESQRLKVEVASLRKRLGFGPAAASSRTDGLPGPGSRSIPLGQKVELLSSEGTGRVVVEGTVVRNDETELIVEAQVTLEDRFASDWRVRYCADMSMWECEMRAIRCENRKLILRHTERVRLVNRRQFPRVSSSTPALVARFPLVRDLAEADPLGAESAGETGLSNRNGAGWSPYLEFVEGNVTEFAGPGLRVRAPLRVEEGERLLILFSAVNASALAEGQMATLQKPVIEHIGFVRHCQTDGNATSFAMELTGLSSVEIAELLRLTSIPEVPSRAGAADGRVAAGSDGRSGDTVTAQASLEEGA